MRAALDLDDSNGSAAVMGNSVLTKRMEEVSVCFGFGIVRESWKCHFVFLQCGRCLCQWRSPFASGRTVMQELLLGGT